MHTLVLVWRRVSSRTMIEQRLKSSNTRIKMKTKEHTNSIIFYWTWPHSLLQRNEATNWYCYSFHSWNSFSSFSIQKLPTFVIQISKCWSCTPSTHETWSLFWQIENVKAWLSLKCLCVITSQLQNKFNDDRYCEIATLSQRFQMSWRTTHSLCFRELVRLNDWFD